MFVIKSADLPFRSRNELARAQQMHGLTRRSIGPASSTFDDSLMRTMNGLNWQQNLIGSLGSFNSGRLDEHTSTKMTTLPTHGLCHQTIEAFEAHTPKPQATGKDTLETDSRSKKPQRLCTALYKTQSNSANPSSRTSNTKRTTCNTELHRES